MQGRGAVDHQVAQALVFFLCVGVKFALRWLPIVAPVPELRAFGRENIKQHTRQAPIIGVGIYVGGLAKIICAVRGRGLVRDFQKPNVRQGRNTADKENITWLDVAVAQTRLLQKGYRLEQWPHKCPCFSYRKPIGTLQSLLHIAFERLRPPIGVGRVFLVNAVGQGHYIIQKPLCCLREVRDRQKPADRLSTSALIQGRGVLLVILKMGERFIDDFHRAILLCAVFGQIDTSKGSPPDFGTSSYPATVNCSEEGPFSHWGGIVENYRPFKIPFNNDFLKIISDRTSFVPSLLVKSFSIKNTKKSPERNHPKTPITV